jgi:hypothetical protein
MLRTLATLFAPLPRSPHRTLDQFTGGGSQAAGPSARTRGATSGTTPALAHTTNLDTSRPAACGHERFHRQLAHDGVHR